jgi:hypothetical protein
MKKLAFLSVMLLFVLSAVQGQPKPRTLKKLPAGNVSEISKNSFIVDFGNIPNVKWKRGETFDEATFKKNGKEMTAYFDIDGKLVGTTNKVTFAEVPANGREKIKTEYKDYKVGPVTFFADNKGNETDMILYGMQFEDADNYFVELTKGTRKIVVQVSPEGNVTFFEELK